MDYTKGGWHVGKEWNVKKYVYDNKGVLVAECNDIVERPDGEVEVNTRLIAAAPDMYEALKRIIDEYYEMPNQEIFKSILSARIAIAKAEDK